MPVGSEDISLFVSGQMGSGTRPTSYTVGTGKFFSRKGKVATP
jgi:hypothetical protein